MFVRFTAVFATLVLIAANATAQTSPQHLSLDEAVRLGTEHSLTIGGAGARVTGSRARLHGASVPANPLLFIGPHAGNELTGGTDEDVLLTQSLELGDKRRQRIHSARWELNSAEVEREEVSLATVFNVREAYFEALRSDAELKLARDELENARTLERAAETRLEAGDVARSNVVRTRLETARATQTFDFATTDRTNSFDSLKSIVGIPFTVEIVLSDEPSYRPVKLDETHLVEYALIHRPDVRSQSILLQAREADLHLARVANQPDFVLEARKRDLDPNNGDASIHVGLQFPLFDAGSLRAGAESAAASLAEQRAALAETMRLASLEVRRTYRTLQQSTAAIIGFETGRLKDARDLREMAQLGYSRGAISYLETLDALQTYRSEQTAYQRAVADYNIALAGLERALGGSLP